MERSEERGAGRRRRGGGGGERDLVRVARAGMVEVVHQRAQECGEELQLGEAADHAKLGEEEVGQEHDVRAVDRVVVLPRAVPALYLEEECAQRAAVKVARLDEAVPVEDGLSHQHEAVSAALRLETYAVVRPRVERAVHERHRRRLDRAGLVRAPGVLVELRLLTALGTAGEGGGSSGVVLPARWHEG